MGINSFGSNLIQNIQKNYENKKNDSRNLLSGWVAHGLAGWRRTGGGGEGRGGGGDPTSQASLAATLVFLVN